jgi:hypothetical protein
MVAATLSEADSIAAAELVLDSLPPGKAQDDVLVGVVQRWTQRDPVAAAEWVSRFPESAVRNSAMENVIKLWCAQDLSAPGQWLGTLKLSPSRDEGLRAYADALAPHLPREAAAWASAIANPELRAAQLERVVANWLQTDRTAAMQWMETAQLPGTLRERLLVKR